MKFKALFKNKKSVTVGYIGGSITEQEGYRKAFTARLRSEYPENEINEVNAAMGGTNSFLGVCRVQRDLISENPDIVFVEFSVNDDNSEYNTFFGRTYEGIVRKLKKRNPDMLIAGVGLTTKGMNDSFYEKGELPNSVKLHKEVCEYYKLPYVNMGKTLFEYMKEHKKEMLEFTNDNVHTNEKGGEFYGDVLWNELKDCDFETYFCEKPLYENNLENATLTLPALSEGWSEGLWKRAKTEKYIYSCTPGSELEIEFSGTAFGIYCTTEKTSGNIIYSVDGKPEKEKPTWDSYALDFDRLHYYTLEDDLKCGKHIAKIRVSARKEEQSEGYYLRIIAFLVEKP